MQGVTGQVWGRGRWDELGGVQKGAEIQTRPSAEATFDLINKRGSWGQRGRDGNGRGWQAAGKSLERAQQLWLQIVAEVSRWKAVRLHGCKVHERCASVRHCIRTRVRKWSSATAREGGEVGAAAKHRPCRLTVLVTVQLAVTIHAALEAWLTVQ